MRYRRLDPLTGDMEFGSGLASFWIDVPEAVAQAVQTRLSLWRGDWFLDQSEGFDWLGEVLGTGTSGVYDIAIQERILGTQNASGLSDYASQRNADARSLTVQATIQTAFGPTPLSLYRLGDGAALPPPITNNVIFNGVPVQLSGQRVVFGG